METEEIKSNAPKTKPLLKKIVIALIILVLLLIIIRCIVGLFSGAVAAGNKSNMGLAVEDSGVIYYNKYEEGIVKVKSGKEYQITDETAYSLSVVGDTIYYLTVSDNGTIDIKSVETNGNNLTYIASIFTSLSKIYVEDGFIYYISNKDTPGISKLNISTREEEKLCAANVIDFELSKGVIFFTDTVGKLHSIKTDGLDQKEIKTEDSIRKFQMLNGHIYYYNDKESGLLRIKKDGSGRKVVSKLVSNDIFNVTSDGIYYYNDISHEIAVTKENSKKSKGVVALKTTKTKINIVGKYIYYLDSGKDGRMHQMYRIKTNGNSAKEIAY
jgi:hypothetical protein